MPRPPITNPPGRDVLIGVARRLFLERGYASVSMQQIADEAGMTKGAPYYHFRNKQDLFVSVSVEILRDLTETMRSSISGDASFRDRIERSFLEITRSMSGDFSRWYNDLLALMDTCVIGSAIEDAFNASSLVALIVPVFEEAHAEGAFTRVPPETAAFAWFMLLKATIDHAAMDKKGKMFADRPLEDIVHDLSDIFFHGIS